MNIKFSDIFFVFLIITLQKHFNLERTCSMFQCLTSWLGNCFLLAIPLTYEHYTYKRGRQWVTLKAYNGNFLLS